MINAETVRFFILNEFYGEARQSKLNDMLSSEGLVEDGFIIDHMSFARNEGDYAVFNFELNNSKFKRGDYAYLQINGDNHEVIIKEIYPNRIYLSRTSDTFFSIRSFETKFALVPSEFDLPLSIAEKAHKLDKNWFVSLLNKNNEPAAKGSGLSFKLVNEAYSDFSSKLDFQPDSSQKNAILQSLRGPEILAIQGPPGTGKTRVLAITANILSILGYEVLVISHSHSAVNNALNEIYAIGKNNNVIKIGHRLKNGDLKTGIHQVGKLSQYYNCSLSDKKNNIIGLSINSAILSLSSSIESSKKRVVLVDEASQIPLSLGSFLGTFQSRSVILYGDSEQMPPIFNDAIVNDQLSISIFKYIEDYISTCFIRLKKTYRLNNHLTNIVGSVFYRDKENGKTFLKSGRKGQQFPFIVNVDKLLLKQIFRPENSFVWVNTPKNFSRQVNKVEADLVSEIVRVCHENNIQPENYVIVTPFRRQINAIQNRIREKIPSMTTFPIIDTVEKVQGQSVEMVIVSYSTSDPDYVKDISRFIYSPNRLNVTISRARTKVIFLCSDVLLNTVPSKYEDIKTQKILTDLKSRSDIVIDL